MVEGHSVHRIASRFRQRLVGKTFSAASPNGRFVEGSGAIDGRVLSNIEAVGKNLFAFFSPAGNNGSGGDDDVVVHVHFGMSGAWAIFNHTDEPETKATTRLRLEETLTGPTCSSTANDVGTARVVAHLSAMTCNHGCLDLFTAKRAALGQDPLRPDADPDALFERVVKSKKSIGQLIMDQSYFAGPGNIYRAEILFLAGVYPTTPGLSLSRASFDKIWSVSVNLLRRGYDTGSILTVDAQSDPELAMRGERRYIYNRSNCARCSGPVSSWNMSGRTCYACHGGCQPKMVDSGVATSPKPTKKTQAKTTPKKTTSKPTKEEGQHTPFVSLCARDSYTKRLEQHGPAGLTIAEIRAHLEHLKGKDAVPPKNARKAVHVEALAAALVGEGVKCEKGVISSTFLSPPKISAEEAAREKATAGENRGVEHVAELSGEQAVSAIAETPALKMEEDKSPTASTARKSRKKTAAKRKPQTSPRAAKSKRRLEFD